MLDVIPSLPPCPTPWNGIPGTPTVEDVLADELEQASVRRFRSRNRDRERKQADRLIREVVAFVARHGTDKIGFLTLTMRQGTSWKAMMEAFSKAVPYLERNFGKEWVRVTGISRRGNLHLHVLVVVPFDIQQGFNRAAREELQELRRSGPLDAKGWGRMKQLTRGLTENAALKQLWKQLGRDMPKCGFAPRIELTPIQANAEAVGKYLAKNMYATAGDPRKPARARVIAYSRSFKKLPPPPPTRRQIEFRALREQLIRALGMTWDKMRSRYGSRWHFRLMNVMFGIPPLRTFSGEICYPAYAQAIERALRPYDSWYWPPYQALGTILDDLYLTRREAHERNVLDVLGISAA